MSDVKLADYHGKSNVVLLFFPLAFTGVCTAEMCDVTAGVGGYEALDAKVIGISVDSPFAQAAWADEGEYRHHAGQRSEQDDRHRLRHAAPGPGRVRRGLRARGLRDR